MERGDNVPNRLKASWLQNKMHSFPGGINTRWKNSKQTRWKGSVDVFLSYFLWFISGFVCVNTSTLHMLVIYIEYQGLFMFGLESPKQTNKKHETHLSLFSTAQLQTTMSVAHFQNHILTWYKTLWNVNIDRRWEHSSWGSDLNLRFSSPLFFPDLQEMLRCHVKVFTVCWQKCHFHGAYLRDPVRAGER